jgi:hypothetical protein
MKMQFERPEYCAGCRHSDFYLKRTAIYANDAAADVAYELLCKSDDICRMWAEQGRQEKQEYENTGAQLIYKCQHCGDLFSEDLTEEEKKTIEFGRIAVKTHIVATHHCKDGSYGCGRLVGGKPGGPDTI